MISGRNQQIADDYRSGCTLEQLSARYSLSLAQLSRIMKKSGAVRPRPVKPYMDAKWIRSQLASGLSAREIALSIDTPLPTIRYWIERHKGNVTARRHRVQPATLEPDLDTREWFVKKYEVDGLGIPTIAKLLGRSFGFVGKKLRDYGIERRSLRRSMDKFKGPRDKVVRLLYDSKLVLSVRRNYWIRSINLKVPYKVRWPDGLITLLDFGFRPEVSDYCKANGLGYLVVSGCLGHVDRVVWRSNVLYSVPRDYLDDHDLNKEIMVHSIISRVCPWQDPIYPHGELDKDLSLLRSEKVESYSSNGFRSVVPTCHGMPGRAIITHFQPHFWRVPVRRCRPLPDAFDDRFIVYRSIWQSIRERESLSFERLLREINYHFTRFGRTSHFAPGFARSIIRLCDASGKRIFDPCAGWGGRLIGAYLEGCKYTCCDISPQTCSGLYRIAGFLGYGCDIIESSCIDLEWPDCDLIFTSPPFFDIERYIGGDQAWRLGTREQWLELFVRPFVSKCECMTVLYLDRRTLEDFELIRGFDRVIEVSNRRHARARVSSEYLGFYV